MKKNGEFWLVRSWKAKHNQRGQKDQCSCWHEFDCWKFATDTHRDNSCYSARTINCFVCIYLFCVDDDTNVPRESNGNWAVSEVFSKTTVAWKRISSNFQFSLARRFGSSKIPPSGRLAITSHISSDIKWTKLLTIHNNHTTTKSKLTNTQIYSLVRKRLAAPLQSLLI